MASTLKQFKSRALSLAGVQKAYDSLDDEFAFLDEVLKARSSAGLTQAQIAERVGTTQSAIARLESGSGKPSVATLQRYARALGCRVEIKFVKPRRLGSRSKENAVGQAARGKRQSPAGSR